VAQKAISVSLLTTRNQTKEKEKQKQKDKGKLTPEKSNQESMMLPTPESKTSHSYKSGNGRLIRN
jgi:hypothetical protein